MAANHERQSNGCLSNEERSPMTTTLTSTTTTSIRHRIGTSATPEQVHDALATVDGLARWWTTDTTGDAAVGGTLVFTFGDPKDRRIVFEVVAVTPDRVEWRGLPGGPDEWVDTRVVFELLRDGDSDETVILFTHADWRDAGWFQAHCSTKWGSYLLSLKALLDGGEGRPFPDDLHISSWD
jgi:uncharacterized protein YndB with AHSA1/START domain